MKENRKKKWRNRIGCLVDRMVEVAADFLFFWRF